MSVPCRPPVVERYSLLMCWRSRVSSGSTGWPCSAPVAGSTATNSAARPYSRGNSARTQTCSGACPGTENILAIFLRDKREEIHYLILNVRIFQWIGMVDAMRKIIWSNVYIVLWLCVCLNTWCLLALFTYIETYFIVYRSVRFYSRTAGKSPSLCMRVNDRRMKVWAKLNYW